MKRTRFRSPPAVQSRLGFTLMEVLLVLVILGVLVGIFLPNLLGQQKKANINAAQLKIKSVEQTCKFYSIDHAGSWPLSIESLLAPDGEDANWKGPYLEETVIPTDPWGSPIQYKYPGEQHPPESDRPDIWSMGPDRQSNTNDDIGNWQSS